MLILNQFVDLRLVCRGLVLALCLTWSSGFVVRYPVCGAIFVVLSFELGMDCLLNVVPLWSHLCTVCGMQCVRIAGLKSACVNSCIRFQVSSICLECARGVVVMCLKRDVVSGIWFSGSSVC